jgi:hypothetical protein
MLIIGWNSEKVRSAGSKSERQPLHKDSSIIWVLGHTLVVEIMRAFWFVKFTVNPNIRIDGIVNILGINSN